MQGPTASVAQAPTSSAPNSNIAGGVVALAALGLAAAAAANSQQQGDGQGPAAASSGAASPQSGSLTPSPGGAGSSGAAHLLPCVHADPGCESGGIPPACSTHYPTLSQQKVAGGLCVSCWCLLLLPHRYPPSQCCRGPVSWHVHLEPSPPLLDCGHRGHCEDGGSLGCSV